jgi:autotransporter-associated beta strand protein
LKLTDYASIGSSAAIVLHDSTATLDLGTLVTPTLNLSATQSLIGCGSVQGNVSTGSASNLIAPSSGKTINADLSTLDYVNLPGGTMAIGGNLSLFGEETLQFKLKSSTTDPNNDKISVGGAVELTGYSLTKVSIIPDTTLTLDATYTVLTSANDWTDYGLGGGFEWDSANNKTRYTFSVDTTSVPRSLLVKVESDDHATLTWSGATNAVWDVIATANWTGGPVDSQFYQADAVNFTDASNVLTVLLGDATNPALCPASITVNSSKDYTFTTDTTHSGWISGGTGIEKSGTGTLTLGGANDFNGTVNITGGTLKIGSTKALGSIEGGTVVNGGTLDLNGYYNLRREPISVQGAGVGGNGALVNNRANQTSGVAPHQYYVTLTGDATLGGSEFWIIQGTTLQGSGWTPGYLHGNNHALTKKGSCEIDLVDLGETNLGNIDIQAGSLWFLGNTTMGNTAATVNISNGATLTLQDSTVVHAKPIVVDATGGVIFDYSGSGAISGGITLYGTAVITTALDNTLTLSGQIIGTGGLTKINYDAAGGKLVLAGANTYEGPTLISAGTLELAETGQISVLSAITNDAVFQVAEGDHTVGTITGTGTTNVLDAATLTATSITQDSLVIGGAGGAVATMAVPEPGTWMLLFVGLLGMAGWGTIRLRSIDRHGAE